MTKTSFKNNPKAKINETYSPEGEEARIREHVYQRFHNMKQGRQKYDQYWDQYEKQWEGWKEEKSSKDWKSNIVAQLSTSIIETLMAEVQQYDIEPPIKGRGYEDVIRAEIMKEAVKHSKQQGDFKLEEEDVKKEAFIYGSGFGEELWWQDARDVQFAREIVGKDGKKEITYDKMRVFQYNGTYFEHTPIRDIWFDEAAKTLNRGRRMANDAIRQLIMTKDAAYDFLSDDRWNKKDNIKYVQCSGDTEFFQFYEPPKRIDPGEEVQILFYWSIRPDALIIVANDVVIHNGPNPYHHKLLPFVQAYDVKRTNALYHKGEMELLESLQEELSKLKRMRLDRIHLTIDPMWLTARRDNISEEDLMSRPHGSIEVDDPMTAARELRPSDTQSSAYKEEESLIQEAQRVTGIDDGSQAVQRTSLTATEFSGLRESTLRKVALKLWHIHNGFHVSFTRLRVANILQYWTQPQYEAVLGDKKSAEYKEMIAELKSSGKYEVVNGQDFKKSYPMIRTTGKRVVRRKGQPSIMDAKGDHFFELKPQDIMPFYQSYDIVYEGTPSLPLTKTIMQTKAAEMIDRILPVALSGVGGYDPGRIMDWYIKKFDEDPDNFKQVEEESQGMGQDQLELAQLENQQMMSGKQIPPTANSVEPHTRIHTAFMKSGPFQQLSMEDPQQKAIVDAFTQHVQGEVMAQQQRGTAESGGQPPVQGVSGQATAKSNQAGTQAGSSPIGGFMRRMLGK
jgi:hypothetical protein